MSCGYHSNTYPEIMFRIVEKQPDFAISMGEINFLQTDDILVTQFPQQLQII